MAIRLQDKTNVDAPNAAFPYGKIRNNPGNNSGTPVNEQVYGDFHQFFARLLDQSGITANGLPDNATNGFQYYLALRAVVQQFVDALVASAPGALDTLNELADALGDDPNFATTVLNAITAEANARIAADDLKVDKQATGFTLLAFFNGASVTPGTTQHDPQYLLAKDGKTYLRGEMRCNTATPLKVSEIPAIGAPASDYFFWNPSGSSNNGAYINVKSNGDIIAFTNGVTIDFSLEMIPGFWPNF